MHAMDKWITAHAEQKLPSSLYAVDTGSNLQSDGGLPGLNADLKPV